MKRARGFTLVEVLVSVTLLSTIVVLLASAFRTLAQTEGRVDRRAGQLDDQRVTLDFLRQLLSRVSGRQFASPAKDGGQAVAFRATVNSIEWLGIMPARPGLGGRHFFRLQLEADQGKTALVLRFAPWDPSQLDLPDLSKAERRTLVASAASFRVLCEGAPPPTANLVDWPQGWVTGWPLRGHLPERIRIQLADEYGAWPDLVISVHALMQGMSTGGDFVVGGSR